MFVLFPPRPTLCFIRSREMVALWVLAGNVFVRQYFLFSRSTSIYNLPLADGISLLFLHIVFPILFSLIRWYQTDSRVSVSGKLLLAFASTVILGSPPPPRLNISLSPWSWVGWDKLLLALASRVIIGSGPRATHDHIFVSHRGSGLGRINCCWPSPAESLLVPGPA
jgi:hypothetical protein